MYQVKGGYYPFSGNWFEVLETDSISKFYDALDEFSTKYDIVDAHIRREDKTGGNIVGVYN